MTKINEILSFKKIYILDIQYDDDEVWSPQKPFVMFWFQPHPPQERMLRKFAPHSKSTLLENQKNGAIKDYFGAQIITRQIVEVNAMPAWKM